MITTRWRVYRAHAAAVATIRVRNMVPLWLFFSLQLRIPRTCDTWDFRAPSLARSDSLSKRRDGHVARPDRETVRISRCNVCVQKRSEQDPATSAADPEKQNKEEQGGAGVGSRAFALITSFDREGIPFHPSTSRTNVVSTRLHQRNPRVGRRGRDPTDHRLDKWTQSRPGAALGAQEGSTGRRGRRRAGGRRRAFVCTR